MLTYQTHLKMMYDTTKKMIFFSTDKIRM